MIRMNGIAHIIVSVSDMQVSAPFYRALCGELLGMTCVSDDLDSIVSLAFCSSGAASVHVWMYVDCPLSLYVDVVVC